MLLLTRARSASCCRSIWQPSRAACWTTAAGSPLRLRCTPEWDLQVTDSYVITAMQYSIVMDYVREDLQFAELSIT